MVTDDELNRRFYDESPAGFFFYRLSSLMWFAERWEDISSLLESPTYVGSVQLGGFESAQPGSDLEHQRERERFVVAESLVLLHHIAEALIRLFLAHRTLASVPWLELAALVDFRRFRASVDSLILGNAQLEEDVEVVFLQGLSDDTSTEVARAFYVSLLRRLARRLLDEGNAYNSAKHGFAVRGGEVSVTIAPENEAGEPIRDRARGFGHGSAVEYIEWAAVEDGRLWKLTTRWVDVPRTVALTYFALEAIKSLWTVGQGRYLGQTEGRIWLPGASLDELLPSRTTGAARTWSTHLGVEPR